LLNIKATDVAELDRKIEEVREWRRFHHDRRQTIEAAACAIRECALLEARAAVLGRIEPGYEFRVCLKS
jgi:hypothetical protein